MYCILHPNSPSLSTHPQKRAFSMRNIKHGSDKNALNLIQVILIVNGETNKYTLKLQK